MLATPQEAKFRPGMKQNYSRPATPQINQGEGSEAMSERPRAQPLYNYLCSTVGQLWSSKMKALAQSSSFMLWGRQFIWCILATSPGHHWMPLALLAYPIVQGGLKISFIRKDEPALGAGTWVGSFVYFSSSRIRTPSPFHGRFDEIDPI